jgi:hypothetical protein
MLGKHLHPQCQCHQVTIHRPILEGCHIIRCRCSGITQCPKCLTWIHSLTKKPLQIRQCHLQCTQPSRSFLSASMRPPRVLYKSFTKMTKAHSSHLPSRPLTSGGLLNQPLWKSNVWLPILLWRKRKALPKLNIFQTWSIWTVARKPRTAHR